jgi:hypothetical protein
MNAFDGSKTQTRHVTHKRDSNWQFGVRSITREILRIMPNEDINIAYIRKIANYILTLSF